MSMKKIISTGLFAYMALSANPAFADKREHNTWVGVGVGALAGGLLSGGDPMSMLGGAAAGGLIGNVTAKNDRDRGRGRGNDRRDDRNFRNDHRNDPRNRDDRGPHRR